MHEFDFKKDVPQAFPVLDDKQLAVVAEFAKCRTYNDGDVLFRAGETDFKFDVIRSGAIEIYDRSSGHSQLILTHEAGEFTGDLANLTGRTSNVDAIAKGETEVYEICEPDLRRIIRLERSDLANIYCSRPKFERKQCVYGFARDRRTIFARNFSPARFSLEKPCSLYFFRHQKRFGKNRRTAQSL
jgi:signal-transduction protein with cAMP-binding, CBS, and nucleotidyltransferase domain